MSATARVTGHSRNTIARWLERASTTAKRFNPRMLRDVDIRRCCTARQQLIANDSGLPSSVI